MVLLEHHVKLLGHLVSKRLVLRQREPYHPVHLVNIIAYLYNVLFCIFLLKQTRFTILKITTGTDIDMSSPLNYGTPSSLSTPRSLLRGAMTPARQRADLRGHQTGPNVPAPTPAKRVNKTIL